MKGSKRKKCYIIAEAGSNHDGSLKQALTLIDVAAEAGADAVKFQIFRAKTMYPKKEIKVKYLKDVGVEKNLYDIIKEMEVPYEWLAALHKHAVNCGIDFMATPFDLESVDKMDKYVDVYKIASYESLYGDLIAKVLSMGKPVLISTGACKDEEIEQLINRFSADLERITLLHCVAKYPTPLGRANLNRIVYLSQKYNVNVGYSDHTKHPFAAPVAANILGATVIEKHFTINKKLPGPDHMFAADPEELKLMVEMVRACEKTSRKKLVKGVTSCEEELYFYKRCLYLKNGLKKGDKIRKKDLKILRNVGEKVDYFNPLEIDKVIGKILKVSKKIDDILKRGDLL
ncbi:MAG: N-acetylneuraminate synthase family protein [Candidatus Aadella gelida]|nr:N-acetylneuraminate synthase family protein [Candidatus Aadella gelida]